MAPGRQVFTTTTNDQVFEIVKKLESDVIKLKATLYVLSLVITPVINIIMNLIR